MSNGNRILSLDEFDEKFRIEYTGAAMPQGHMDQMPQQPEAMTPAQAAPQPYSPQMPEQQMPQYPMPQPENQGSEQDYQALASDLQTYDDPFLAAAQSLDSVGAAQYPAYQQPASPPTLQQQWPPVSPPAAGGYQGVPEQPPEPESFLQPPQSDRKRMGQLVMTGVTAFVVILLIAAVFVPKLVFGIEFVSMNSAEMGDTIPVGSLVIIKKTPYEQIKVNDIVTYEFERGQPITRRVVTLYPETKNFAVKGDAATTSVTVNADRMRGKLS